MTESTETRDDDAQFAEHQWADFLTSLPPGSTARIPDLVGEFGRPNVRIAAPDLLLHCNSDACRGERIFAAVTRPTVQEKQCNQVFIAYSCRNCTKTQRLYALLLHADDAYSNSGVAIKIGEWPPFGPPTPARVISMVGPDRDLFLKGRRAENQGLGLGAFAYYRRVVENQRGRLLGEIIRVAKRMGARTETVQSLEAAVAEQQFSRSIELTKDAIPESLLIDGHNPLLLLHRALSVGLHNLPDEECLARARSIRVVLTELAERISQNLKDTAELKEAISHLLAFPEAPDAEETKETG
jgi:hypothetical protein